MMSGTTVEYSSYRHLYEQIEKCKDNLHKLNEEREKESRHLMELLACLAKLKGSKVIEKNSPEKLCNEEIRRYSRQLILSNVSIHGQTKLKNTSFLVVGMGGLGCPAAQYLAAAGCGVIGLMDYDVVELNNLHRQILYTQYQVGSPKVHAAASNLQLLNQFCKINPYNTMLNSDNASKYIAQYDVILDCTDNGPSRYLLNDTCVRHNKPLVSGSALQMDGQLAIYNYGENGLCYRCLHAVPPPASMVRNCSDGGVLGAVTGVIGTLQALEAMKIALHGRCGIVQSQRLLLFDGLQSTFRSITLRSRRANCEGCSEENMNKEKIDYEQFCGVSASDKDYALTILSPKDRIDVCDYQLTFSNESHLLIDVREPIELMICKLPNAINIPLEQILNNSFLVKYEETFKNAELPIYVVCRRGNDSQIAVQHMRSKLPERIIKDLDGGLYSWHYKVDQEFPLY